MNNSDLNDIEKYKPYFHITGEQGWINDPNGLIKFKGKYHVFYQSYPADAQWGPMVWGHSVSEDLTHWEYLPNALYPDRKYDRDGCFSGSAIEWNGELYLMYTGFSINGGGDKVRQVQCLAKSSDGVSFKKLGVVIGEEQLPDGFVPADFRDPKVWRENGKFYVIVAARRKHARGRLLVYSSDDLLNWKFELDVFDKDCPGIMTECPDYNPDSGLLMYSEQFAPVEGNKHLNLHTTRYVLGKIDHENKVFKKYGRDGICDYGFDFYAPQTFSGENIEIGWMNMWDRNNPTSRYGFAGMMTVPRKLEIKEGRLFHTPVVNCKQLFTKKVEGEYKDKIVSGVIKISAENIKSFSLKMREGEGFCTKLDLVGGEWIFDRSASGEVIRGHEKDADSHLGIRRMPYSGEKYVELTIVFDKYSVEIFESGRVLTSTIYPPEGADNLQLTVQADNCTVTRYQVI